jgi:hypothetical protein
MQLQLCPFVSRVGDAAAVSLSGRGDDLRRTCLLPHHKLLLAGHLGDFPVLAPRQRKLQPGVATEKAVEPG